MLVETDVPVEAFPKRLVGAPPRALGPQAVATMAPEVEWMLELLMLQPNIATPIELSTVSPVVAAVCAALIAAIASGTLVDALAVAGPRSAVVGSKIDCGAPIERRSPS